MCKHMRTEMSVSLCWLYHVLADCLGFKSDQVERKTFENSLRLYWTATPLTLLWFSLVMDNTQSKSRLFAFTFTNQRFLSIDCINIICFSINVFNF